MVIRPISTAEVPQVLEASIGTTWESMSRGEQAMTEYESLGPRVRSIIDRLLGLGGTILVAEVGGRLAGYITTGVLPNDLTERLEGMIFDTWVHPSCRRQGVGSSLIRAAEDYCRDQGATRATMVVATHNDASQRSALKSGYRAERVWFGKDLL